MKLITTTTDKLSSLDVMAINTVVARAFGHSNSEEQMVQDTKNHLNGAETVQITVDDDRPVALAMYRSCLWRPGY